MVVVVECLKLEADESPYVHWVNSRYRVNTKLLIITLRRSYQYLTIVRYFDIRITSIFKFLLQKYKSVL